MTTTVRPVRSRKQHKKNNVNNGNICFNLDCVDCLRVLPMGKTRKDNLINEENGEYGERLPLCYHHQEGEVETEREKGKLNQSHTCICY